jgi:hypothetical protein
MPQLDSETCCGIDTTAGQPSGGGVTPSDITLQAAIDGQSTTPTEQSFSTAVDLNAGASWSWRDSSNNAILSIADGTGVTIAEGYALTGIQDVTLGAGTTNDLAVLATTNVLRITPNASGSTLTGIATPRSGRQIEVFNVSTTASLTLSHDTGSTTVNRFLLPNSSSLVVPPNSSVIIWDDNTSQRWRTAASAGAVGSPGTTQVQDFTNTAGGTFDVAAAIAAGFTFVHVIAIGAGGGGGGGASTTTPGGALAVGGCGGGGGCRYEQTFRLSELAASIAISVGTGGTGGNGGSNGNGTSGTAGGNSSFGTHLVAGGGGGGFSTVISNTASGGAGGGLGSVGGNGASGADSAGGGPGPMDSQANGLGASGGKGGGSRNNATIAPGSTEYGGAGGAGCVNSIANTQPGGSSWWGGAGGGLGGGHNTVGGSQVATAGGSQRSTTAGGGGAPGTTGNTTSNGSNGAPGTFTTPGSGGGGGGGISGGTTNQAGGRGGDGGTYGNGGGGGGATAGNGAGAPQTGGRGGDGAQGAVRVILS